MKLKVFFTMAVAIMTVMSVQAQNKKPVAGKAKAPGQAKATSPKVVVGKPVVVGGSTVLKTEIDSLSYAIGVNIGQSLKQQGLENINTQALQNALNDILTGKTPAIEPEACIPIIMKTMQKQQAAKYGPLKEAGEKFMAENKTKEGVVTLPSGLQYTIMKAGEGEKPKATDKVNVHYHGTTTDGKVFDSSVDRGQPAQFGVTQVIPGWVEALQLMPAGSKWKLFIPQELAYGERGAGENIPPFSPLIFEVELISIEK